jgi:M6 family metalloprotease-like protein
MKTATGRARLLLAVLIGVGLFSLSTSPALAVPASSAIGTTQQPDGTVIQGRLFGDEFYHWSETVDGYVIMQSKDGWWRYAVKDATGDLVAGPQRVGVDPRPAGLQPMLRPDDQVLSQKIRAAKRALGYREVLPAPAGVAPQAVPINLPPKEVEPRGTVKNLVILARFSDTPASTSTRPSSEYYSLFNQTGYSADGAVGSVKDYYQEVSYNNLTLASTVTAWVTLPNTQAYYGADAGPTTDLRARQMVVDAINAASVAGLNFSQFDTDGDGWIDAIDIIHSGYGQEYFGAPTDYIWSHRWFLGDTTATLKNGVWISGYHTEPALRNLSGTNIVRIGVICHETGHFFGLPDLYDTDGSGSGGYGNGVGAWCLMASGSWGANGNSWPQRPTHMCGWSKMQMGWLDPSAIHTQNGWPLLRVEDNSVAYSVREGLPDAESFLVSNRQATGFDANLLNAGGLEILHVDEANPNNKTPYDLKVTFEEADGNWSLMNAPPAGARAQAGDPWPGSANRTSFSGATTPNTNSNPSLGGSASSISFSSISANGNPMTFNLLTLVPTVDVPATDPDGSYNATWTASAGATQYELQEATTTTVTSYSDNCNTEAQFRGDWIALGTVRRVVPPTEADSVYVAQFYDSATTTWYDTFYSLKLRKRFRVTASTTISYSIKYRLTSSGKDANVGYFQIRRVGNTAWTSLTKFTGDQTGAWASQTETAGELAAFVGSDCEVRFLAINNAGSVWTSANWPYDGFAIEDFSINNAQIVDYSWTTLSATATSPYAITKGVAGTWFYRVRAFSGGSWRDWSNVDGVRVTMATPPTITAATVQDLGTAAGWEAGLAVAQTGYANERAVRIAVTATGDTPTQIRVAESLAGLNAASYVAFTPPNYNGYLLSNSDGGKDIWVQVQGAGGESNQFNIGGVGTDIVLDRVAPASTGLTAPATGAALRGGGSSPINWNAFTDASGIKVNSLFLHYDTSSGSGGYPNLIASSEANDGAYTWSSVPAINSTTVRVRIQAYDRAGNVGSVANSGNFTIDSTRPRLVSAVGKDASTLDASFNETVVNANQRLNFSCSNRLPVLSVLPMSGTLYRLRTGTQLAGTSYTLTVSYAVTDRAGNAIDPTARMRAFTGGSGTSARSWTRYR